MMIQRKYKGFTLIELVTVMGIMMILGTIAVPTMRDMLESNRVRNAAEELYQRFLMARSVTIEQQQDVAFNFHTGTNWCYGSNITSNCFCQRANSCAMGSVTTKNNQVSLTTTGFNGSNAKILAGRGRMESSGSATFSLNGKSVTISASKMGRISLCSDTVGGYKAC